jgi:hypothetical protein
MGSDNEGAAKTATSLIGPDDPRVRHFYDPGRTIGKAVSRSLGWANPDTDWNAAWDIYLFYPPGVKWEDELPPPATMMHQLWGRSDGYRTGQALVQGLHDATAGLLRPQ